LSVFTPASSAGPIATPSSQLDELVLDPTSGVVTGLVMRKGHLWGSRDVTVPVEQVEYVDGETVYLRLDKSEVGALPAMKVRRG
jgi:hypothetical protein